MQTWIFQGNPDVFDIDGYLAKAVEEITWLVTRYASEIAIGEASGFYQQRAPRQNRAQREDALLAGSGEFERTVTDEIELAPAVS
jgi:hypothetical protein